DPSPDHLSRLLAFALDMGTLLAEHNAAHGHELQFRIGVNTGPVTAGVIGSRKFTYDLWGDTVNVASRMESSGISGRVQVSESVATRTGTGFVFEERGMVSIKGKGEMRTFLLVGPEEAS
ncbi:MAG: adenylate/guanylate cyclase domain-containing protein, partial [Myxococcota bacterium]|nr:adenylate/guanylate cyclase domain-containing protein [Myxococcota bacterium]